MNTSSALLVEVKSRLDTLGTTHWTLPSDGAPYPFLVIGATIDTPENKTKDERRMEKEITIDMFDRAQNRATIEGLLLDAKRLMRGIYDIGHGFSVDHSKVTAARVIKDTSTSQELYHGILQVEFTLKEE